MVSLPRKGEKGQNFKSWAVDSINRLIDYLTEGTYLRKGDGVSIERTPSGIIIGLEKKAVSTPQQLSTSNGGGETQDISASVSGGTSSIMLSGSTSSVNLVGTGDVTISGNTETGAIEINCTGGGGGSGAFFPDYAEEPIPVVDSVRTDALAANMWLIGTAGLYKTSSSSFPSYVRLKIYSTDGSTVVRTLYLCDDTGIFSSYNTGNNFDFSVCLPIAAGYRIEVVATGSSHFELNLYHASGQIPLADYTVTRASGTTSGSLFYGLSERGDNTVSVDSSLNGTPLDFEGASVL